MDKTAYFVLAALLGLLLGYLVPSIVESNMQAMASVGSVSDFIYEQVRFLPQISGQMLGNTGGGSCGG